MKLKKGMNPRSKMRTKLLRLTMDMDLSTSTQLEIARQLKDLTDEKKEEKARQIFDMLILCKTETDIIEKLLKL